MKITVGEQQRRSERARIKAYYSGRSAKKRTKAFREHATDQQVFKSWMIVMRKTLRRLPAEGTKGRKKLEAIVRLDRPRGAEKRGCKTSTAVAVGAPTGMTAKLRPISLAARARFGVEGQANAIGLSFRHNNFQEMRHRQITVDEVARHGR